METVETAAREKRQAMAEAVHEFEMACNVMALVFADARPEVREIVIRARGDVREALGEART